MFGCGEGSQVSNTTLTVSFVPDPGDDPASATVEYSLVCKNATDWRDVDPATGSPLLLGDIEPVGPSTVNDAQGFVWSASVNSPPGPCQIQIRMRDAEGEIICTNCEEFTVAADAPTEVDIFMGCELSPF
jgi:hypothetical protein